MGLSNDHLELDWTEWPVHRNRVEGKWTFQPPFWIKLNDQFTETWWRANGTFQPPFWTKLNNQFTDRVEGKWDFTTTILNGTELNHQFTETGWRANGTFQKPSWTGLNWTTSSPRQGGGQMGLSDHHPERDWTEPSVHQDRVEGKWDFTTTILNGTEPNHQFTESGWRANGTFRPPSWTGLNWTTSSPRQGGRQMGLSNYHVELNWTTSLQRQGGGQMGLSNHHVELAWTAWPVHRDSEQNFIMREESLPLCFSLFVTSGGFGAGSLPSLPVLSCICNTVSEHISLAVSHIRGRGISHASLPSLPVLSCICNTVSEHISLAVSHIRGRGISHASLLLPLSWKINTKTWHHSILNIKSTLH